MSELKPCQVDAWKLISRIKKLRRCADLTYGETAQFLEMKKREYWAIECGEAMLTYGTLFAFTNELIGGDVADIFTTEGCKRLSERALRLGDMVRTLRRKGAGAQTIIAAIEAKRFQEQMELKEARG